MKHVIRSMVVLLVIGLCMVPESWAYDYVDPSTMKDRMYKTIDGLPCVRLIGNSGPIGCTTGEGGAIGWLYAIETQAHISEFLSLSGVDGKAIAFMAPSVFQRENVISLVETNQIAGIIVYHGEPYASYQSPESTYPNAAFGLYKNPTYKWNPQGNGWLFEKQNVPIFYVDANTTQELLPLARLNKEKGFPKWAAKLSAWMMTTYDQDSETCLRRDNCDPVGGKNVWGSFNPPSTFKKDKIVFVSASQDSNAFFHDLAPGAAANVADVAALVGAMEALRHIDRKTFTNQIVFSLFTGESWGFIGSKAFVKDIQGFECTTQPSPDYCSFPYRTDTNFTYVDIKNIDSFIQLDQIGTVTSDNAEAKQLYFHFDPDFSTPDQIITALKSAALPLDVVASKSSVSQIPPSSVMSFMKARKDMPALVLSNYDKNYVNEYYHSSFDDLSNVDAQRVCDVSSILARTIFSLATDSDQKVTLPEGFGANCTFTTALLQCFAGSFDCPLFTEYYYAPDAEVPETTNYAGVYRKSHVSINSKFLFDIMSNITARHHYEACNKTSECLASGATCVGHRCITGPTVYYHDALSPGLKYQNGRYVVVDNSEPLWTEASWHSTYIQLFEMSNPSKDVAILSLGVAECLLCFVTVYFGRKLLRKRFKMA